MRSRARGLAAVAALCLALPAAAAAQAPEPRDGWAQDALGLQYDLGSDVGFTDSQWLGTHNSFNTSDQTGITLSSEDSNQQIVLTDQLDAGIRSLELDVHKTIDGMIRVCHGRGADQFHFGCTTEKGLAPTLTDITGWLDSPENADQVLLLYLEDHMEDAAGYDEAASIVSAGLGDRLFTPPTGGGCTEVPGTLTRDNVRAAGKQVFIVSDCGPGTGWAQVAFNWDSHVESRPVNYADFPDCGPDYDLATYDTRFVRYFEDSTALTNQVGPPTGIATEDDGLTPPTAAAMMRCGVDLIGFDQITGPADPRFAASVWSWQVNRPRMGPRGNRNCAMVRAAVPVAEQFGDGDPATTDTRPALFDTGCAIRPRVPACRNADGSWRVLKRPGRWAEARKACERRGLALGTPRTGFEMQRLAEAMEARGATKAWTGYRLRQGTWTATDPPPAP